MSLTSPATLRLMEALAEAGAQGASREALVRLADISVASFYRALEPLQHAGLVHEQGGQLVLPLSHPYNYAFKLWRDQDRLLQLPAQVREELYGLVERLQVELGPNLLALWLVGSAAHLTLHAGSDLDLVVVVRKEQASTPRGSRPIQLTLFTESTFREAYRRGDNFVLTALAHGVLLCDRGFAQPFYAEPLPTSGLRAVRQREETLEHLESRVYFFLREDALEDARQTLKAMAVALGRGLLEPLGELPAGKTDLVAMLALYYGPAVEQLVNTGLGQAAPRGELPQLVGEFAALQRRFQPRAKLLTQLARSLSGSARGFVAAVQQMLETLFPGRLLLEPDHQADVRIQLGSRTVNIVMKSLKGPLGPDQLERVAHAGAQLVVLNLLRELLPSQRPPLPDALHEKARALHLVLLDSRELFQLHNRVLLETHPPEADAWLKGLLRQLKMRP